MRLEEIEKKIEKIKRSLVLVQAMRPGSISKQYSVCGKKPCRCVDPDKPKKHGPYYQLSYAHKGKSTSMFIQPQYYHQVKREVEQYKKFKLLIEQWIELAIQYSQGRISHGKSQEHKRRTNKI